MILATALLQTRKMKEFPFISILGGVFIINERIPSKDLWDHQFVFFPCSIVAANCNDSFSMTVSTLYSQNNVTWS